MTSSMCQSGIAGYRRRDDSPRGGVSWRPPVNLIPRFRASNLALGICFQSMGVFVIDKQKKLNVCALYVLCVSKRFVCINLLFFDRFMPVLCYGLTSCSNKITPS